MDEVKTWLEGKNSKFIVTEEDWRSTFSTRTMATMASTFGSSYYVKIEHILEAEGFSKEHYAYMDTLHTLDDLPYSSFIRRNIRHPDYDQFTMDEVKAWLEGKNVKFVVTEEEGQSTFSTRTMAITVSTYGTSYYVKIEQIPKAKVKGFSEEHYAYTGKIANALNSSELVNFCLNPDY
ncbi:hypothetical protein BGZ80_003815 [Entomortierella chlamydospora]|uniref:Uncharacterized protein n=1 Tax=Entomortierella chlamydospora TaxID=101097 RepID=A0A9P6N0H9_9FUNG|nr:hypothetical protein BGZ80_003815 [Entomortierella chlamydospora]